MADWTPPTTDLVAWHHLRVEVPWTWEVTAYAIEDRVGRLEFNDRHGLLATIGWEPCDREPDREGTMRVFLQNNVLGKDAARRIEPDDLEVADIGPFRLGWDRKGAGPCQALAWHKGHRKLLRWTFEPCVRTGGLRWDAALRPILSTWGFNDGPETEYRLRGLHCRLPAGYELEDVSVHPLDPVEHFAPDGTLLLEEFPVDVEFDIDFDGFYDLFRVFFEEGHVFVFKDIRITSGDKPDAPLRLRAVLSALVFNVAKTPEEAPAAAQ